MFGEVAQEGRSVVFGGVEKVWFVDGPLSASQASEETFVGSEARVEVGAVFCELLSLEFEVGRNKWPVQGRHPIGNVVVFMDPGLIVSVM